MAGNDVVKVGFDADTGIATLTLAMEGRANKINEAFGNGLAAAVDEALAMDGLRGIIIGTAHRDFCVGADIDVMFRERDPARVLEGVRGLSGLLRKIETSGVPVVAALTGSALGGGYELAMACHHRIAIDSGRIMVGLPEVSLGLIPGAGGTQRLPRMIGLQAGLEHIVQGKIVRAPRALKSGLVDELASDAEDLRAKAGAWIAANPKASQPWDKKGFRFPGGAQPGREAAVQLFMGGASMLYGKTAGAIPAPEIAMIAVHEGTLIDFDRALEVEARHFAALAVSDTAKDMIRTFWYHRTAAERCDGLPSTDDQRIKKVAILGAGMMGSGLAFSCAAKGYEVVLKDIAAEALEGAEKHCVAEAKKRKHWSDAQRQELLDRITYTLEYAPLAGSDLVIEAVVEDDRIKAQVTQATEEVLGEDAIFASNTSGIPITHLAKASRRPPQFIGLHFFSPVEKMPLIEIIRGEATDDDTLARCLAFCRALGKTPIVVGDGYGFYTSRIFGAYLLEGVQSVAEGHDPVLIEWAAREAGQVMPPLKVFDEVSLRLGHKGIAQRERYTGEKVDSTGIELIKTMVEEHGRLGKVNGKGFYDYVGRERRIWPGLRDLVDAPAPARTGVEYLKRRLMLAYCVEVARTVEEGIIINKRDAEIGAVFGLGFAPASGGPLAWMDRYGAANLVRDLQELAAECGPRFDPPQILRDMAAHGETFFEQV